MNNNELNNNEQNDFQNQIMTENNENIVTQPNQSAINLNQGMNTIIQNNLNNTQNESNIETSSEDVDTIFSDIEPMINEPVNDIPTTTKKKKSKGPIIVIILSIIIFLIAGYITYDKFISKNKVTPPTKNVDKTQSKTEQKPLLIDENKEVVYSLVDEKHNGVIRRVPYVNISSKYAVDINDELDKLTKKGYLEGQVKDSYLEYQVDYQYYINDEIVSIKFSWETESGNMTYSKIYNINQYTGEKVSQTDILKKMNIDSKELSNKLVESYKIARPFETIGTDEPIKECYQKDLDTLAKGDIKGMYLNYNELYVLFDMNYPAGSGIGEVILNVTANKLILNPVTLE